MSEIETKRARVAVLAVFLRATWGAALRGVCATDEGIVRAVEEATGGAVCLSLEELDAAYGLLVDVRLIAPVRGSIHRVPHRWRPSTKTGPVLTACEVWLDAHGGDASGGGLEGVEAVEVPRAVLARLEPFAARRGLTAGELLAAWGLERLEEEDAHYSARVLVAGTRWAGEACVFSLVAGLVLDGARSKAVREVLERAQTLAEALAWLDALGGALEEERTGQERRAK